MEAIRLFNQEEGLGSFDNLCILSEFPLKQVKEGDIPTDTGLMILEELYMELVRRAEISPIQSLPLEDKERYWNEAILSLGRSRKAVKFAKCLYLVNKIY